MKYQKELQALLAGNELRGVSETAMVKLGLELSRLPEKRWIRAARELSGKNKWRISCVGGTSKKSWKV